MTTLVSALRAIESGDPFALRRAVDAMGVALDYVQSPDAKDHLDPVANRRRR